MSCTANTLAQVAYKEETVVRCTAWPLAVASGIIADYSVIDCNYTRNKGKIVHRLSAVVLYLLSEGESACC